MWFEVDKAGLGKVLARKGKAFLLHELIQNALDEPISRIAVTLQRVPGTRSARLTVEDDAPDGFADLSHTFVLFAESKKKADATKRGRFNLGEKMCLALCDEAEIRSTKGGFRFDESGRHAIRAKREAGSLFSGTLKMTNEEMAECDAAVRQLLVPVGIELRYNGELIASRRPLQTVSATLPTEIADEEGRLRKTSRKTSVEFYAPQDGEEAMLYELGIPVVATGDRFSINILQKIPLNLDRDNVTPAYLAAVRALAVAHLTEALTVDDANATWVRDALESHGDTLPEDTVKRLVDLRFGEKRVAYDPSDPEANSRAVSEGYVVVHGGQLSKAEWNAVKRVGAIQPAGQVLPTYKPYQEGGQPATYVPEAQWSSGMQVIAHATRNLGRKLLGFPVGVLFETGRMTSPWTANYGGGTVTFNHDKLGKNWFAQGVSERFVDLLIHELAHHYASDHLSDDYYKALSALGAKLAILAVNDMDVADILATEQTKVAPRAQPA